MYRGFQWKIGGAGRVFLLKIEEHMALRNRLG